MNCGLIKNWDFDIIYKINHTLIAVRKRISHWKIVPSLLCLEYAFYHCRKTKHFIMSNIFMFQKRVD